MADTRTEVGAAGKQAATTMLPKFPSPSKTLPQAIATMEGYYVTSPPSRARRNNNPGNIEWGPFARRQGATSVEPNGLKYQGRFAVFPSAAIGFAALTALLQSNAYCGLTVAETIARYAPPTENDTSNYCAQVCQWCACEPGDNVVDVLLRTTGRAGRTSVAGVVSA